MLFTEDKPVQSKSLKINVMKDLKSVQKLREAFSVAKLHETDSALSPDLAETYNNWRSSTSNQYLTSNVNKKYLDLYDGKCLTQKSSRFKSLFDDDLDRELFMNSSKKFSNTFNKHQKNPDNCYSSQFSLANQGTKKKYRKKILKQKTNKMISFL
jgi:hypothetical protein